MRKPFCVVPFVEAFSGYGSAFRNCCATDPQITSKPGQTFAQWWQDPDLEDFRQHMWKAEWLPECHRCQRQEIESGHSFRTAVNTATADIKRNFGPWPNRWNLKFGNTCNLACWTCNEHASSVIAQHKRKSNLLPIDWQDPEQVFQQQWPDLRDSVLKSYEFHDVITLTLVGGEPLYNRTVKEFLQTLLDLGLAPRTQLEFHTNATVFDTELFADRAWHYVCVFLSLDAVGNKAEWLRYGCRWPLIVENIAKFQTTADYVETHCTLSVLNIGDLPELHEFCQAHNLPLKISMLTDPKFMNITQWSGDPDLLVDQQRLEELGYGSYYQAIGSNPNPESAHQLNAYIQQFNSIRRNLAEFDPELCHAIKVSTH